MNKLYNLNDLGWNENLSDEFKKYEDSFIVGRICAEYKNMYKIYSEYGEIFGTISGKMNFEALSRSDFPAVGDWVVIDKYLPTADRTIIHKIFPRKSKFSRKVAGNVIDEQIIAVNIDTLFICMSLNNNFNLRRLERYTTMAWESGSTPVILLTKSDLCNDVENKLYEIKTSAIGIDVHVVSSANATGIESVKQYITQGKTAAFLGSSGVGKSTLINKLIGENILKTSEIRSEDDKGRHTTTHRELFILPSGGVVIDTPGMREFQILDAEEGIENTFEDINVLSLNCKFSDCKHDSEPGCAVIRAIEEGTLSKARFNNYLKLKKEAEFIARKNSKAAASTYKKELKRHFK